MGSQAAGQDREIVEIAQSLEFMSEDCKEIASSLEGKDRHAYLALELRKMEALRVKLKYLIRKLEKLTGQSPSTRETFPF